MKEERKPVISLENVRKSRGDFELGPVRLDIEPGYVVAVVGPNGGGKSTLFGLLMNLLQPDSGGISLFGGCYPRDEVEIKRRVGYVPDRPTGYAEMDARALERFASRWYPGWDSRVYQDLLGRLRVDPSKRFTELSGGVGRRLSFAFAMATTPDLLLLDEPTGGVDPMVEHEMLDTLWAFVHDDAREDMGRTAVFSTHSVEEAARVADYVMLLSEGEFLGLYEKDALFASWRAFWVDVEPEAEVAGVIDDRSLGRLISNSPRETREALRARDVEVLHSSSLNLKEILYYLLHRGTGAQGA